MNKAVNDDVAQLSGGVMPVTFYDNVCMGLNLCFTTWAAGGEIVRGHSVATLTMLDVSEGGSLSKSNG